MAFGKKAKKQSSNREFKKVAQVALWNAEGGGENAPILNGSITFEDESEMRISLWESDSDHERAPVLTGWITEEIEGPSRGKADKAF